MKTNWLFRFHEVLTADALAGLLVISPGLVGAVESQAVPIMIQESIPEPLWPYTWSRLT